MQLTSFQKVMIGTGIFALSSIVAVFGYWMAGWSLLEAVYMVTITIYGVGYGEVRPIDEPGLKLFTIGVIVAGCTSAIYVLGGFVQMIAEGELNRVLGARRMTKGIEKLTDHVIVCGYGRVGRILATELAHSKQSFVAIDTDQERLREAEESGMFVITGDATEEQTLESAGILRARVLATVLSDDTANVFITLTARELNPDVEIIARGESPSTEKKLLRSGANRVVLPAAIGAARIARMITRPSAEQLLSASCDHETMNEDLGQIGLLLTEFRVAANSASIGRPLSELSSGTRNRFIVIAVRHTTDEITRNPADDYIVQLGDALILLADHSAVPRLREKVAGFEMVYRGARR
jgi:voltage-gated potassium channel